MFSLISPHSMRKRAGLASAAGAFFISNAGNVPNEPNYTNTVRYPDTGSAHDRRVAREADDQPRFAASSLSSSLKASRALRKLSIPAGTPQ